nr:TVP38/TMEM64 family protein [Ardenticatena sp.]
MPVKETKSPLPTRKSSWRRHRSRLFALLFWSTAIFAYWGIAARNGLHPTETARLLARWVRETDAGFVAFMVFYVLRPFIAFPAIFLTALSGYLFGPLWGTLIALVGNNASGIVGYALGRFFGKAFLESTAFERIAAYRDALRRRTFETILIMRFMVFPQDLLDYLSGFLHLSFRAYVLATFIGSIPGTISIAWLGASIEGEFSGVVPHFNPSLLLPSLLMLGLSLLAARLIRQRAERLTTPSNDT